MNNPNFNKILSEALTKYNRKTNADRIRAMTDEELARILAEGCHGTIECPNCCGEYTGTIKSCTECWLDWLKEEVKEE